MNIGTALASRWYPWGGAALGAVLADWADLRVARQYSTRFTNAELVSFGLIAADVFGVFKTNPAYRSALTGASDWAVGNLAQSFARQYIVPPVPVATPKPASTSSNNSVAASTNTLGLTGVPASGGSTAFDLPMGGF